MQKNIQIRLSILIPLIFISCFKSKEDISGKIFTIPENLYKDGSESFHNSLAHEEILSIYLKIIGDIDSCYIENKIYYNAGLTKSEDNTYIMMDDQLISDISNYWNSNSIKSTFILNSENVINKRTHRVINGYSLISIGLIKSVGDNVILVGFERYRGPLAAMGTVYKFSKRDNKWILIGQAIPWVS